jgi:hypothetical protein
MVGGVCCGCLFGDRQFNLTTVSVRMRSRPAPLLLRRPSSTRPEAHGLWGATRTIHGADEGSALGFVAAFRPVLLAALGVVYKEVVPDADDAAYRAFVAVLAADIQQDAIERALAAWLRPGSGRQCPMSVTAIFPQIIWPQSRATDRRPPQACVLCPSTNTCLPHAPPAGHWSSLALVSACQGQSLFWEPKAAFDHRSANKSHGSDAHAN